MIRRALAATLLIAATGGAAGAQPGGILGRAARIAGAAVAAQMPIGIQKEVEIGRGIAGTVAGRWGLDQNAAVTEYVNLVGQVVAQQSPRNGEITFRFAVLDTEEVNAFAAPGGYIFITRGALDMMESESELAAVLGHEIAHVDLRHILRRIQRADAVRGMTREADLSGPIMDQLLSLGASTLFTGMERGDELESDSLGMLYASAAGYRGDGMKRFLEKMNHGSEEHRRGFASLTVTHPGLPQRIEAVQADATAAGIDMNAGPSLEDRYRRYVPRSTSPPE